MTRALLLALVAALAAAASPAAASAAVPCWQRLIADYSDGRIDGTYPVSCYGAALAHLPEDVRVYSSAEDDIHRALLASVARRANATGTKAAAHAQRPARTLQVSNRAEPVATTPSRPRADVARDPVLRAASRTQHDVATRLPLPVLVSAALGAVLVAAGAASGVRRRLRSPSDQGRVRTASG